MTAPIQQPSTPLIFARHIVGMGILSLASPYVWYGSERTVTWLTTWITPLAMASVAFGLYALFFTKKARAAWPGSFFMLAWVMLGLAVATPYFEKHTQKQVLTTERHAPVAPPSPSTPPQVNWSDFTPVDTLARQ